MSCTQWCPYRESLHSIRKGQGRSDGNKAVSETGNKEMQGNPV